MAKIKRNLEIECSYVLYPVGNGLPLCAYTITKEHKLADAKLMDFPVCDKHRCPKVKGDKTK